MPEEFYLSADAWVVIAVGGPHQRQHAVQVGTDANGNREYTFPCGMGRRSHVAVFSRRLIEGREVCGQRWCQHRARDHEKFNEEIEQRIAEDEAEIASKMRAARESLKQLERRLVRK